MAHVLGKAWFLAVSALAYSEVAVAKDFNLDQAHVPDQLVVRFAPAMVKTKRSALQARFGAKSLHTFQSGAQQWQLPSKGDERALFALAKTLAAQSGVLSVEANTILHADATIPNDPDFGKLYGMNNDGSTGGVAGASIHAAEAWDLTTGSKSVVVGVIDTGIDYTHPDLKDNMWTNSGETGLDANGVDKASNGVDDDNNGYIDDWHGWDFVNNDNDPMDDAGHGTHVSGTIGARGNDGVGVVGVNWDVSIVGLKFLSASGSGTLVDAVKAIEYSNSLGVTLTSNSWGGGGYSDTMDAAIKVADEKGILFVAAAGNDSANNDRDPHYPSSYAGDNIIAVAATDNKDAIASFSCFGAATVDVAAPGVDIYSSAPGNIYKILSGTSMATPHVAGIAALIKSHYPDATAAQIKARILNTVDPVASLQGVTLTGGRVNAFNALENDLIAPNAVADVAVVESGLNSIKMSWTAAGDDGAQGRAKRYDVRVAATPIDSDAAWAAATPAAMTFVDAGAGIEATILNLPYNSSGYLAVKPVDNVGNLGPRSASVAYEVKHLTKVMENSGDSLDGVTVEATWGLEQDAASGTSYFSDSPTGAYGDNLNASLTLAPLSVSSSELVLNFKASYDFEAGYDFGLVEISRDGGASWVRIDSFSGSSNGWVEKSYTLSSFLGAAATTVQVRFRVTSDYSIDRDGLKIDDIVVFGPQ